RIECLRGVKSAWCAHARALRGWRGTGTVPETLYGGTACGIRARAHGKRARGTTLERLDPRASGARSRRATRAEMRDSDTISARPRACAVRDYPTGFDSRAPDDAPRSVRPSCNLCRAVARLAGRLRGGAPGPPQPRVRRPRPPRVRPRDGGVQLRRDARRRG